MNERLKMHQEFKVWHKTRYGTNNKSNDFIHSTQERLDEYLKAHPHHPVVRGVIFEEEIILTGNHEKLEIESVCFINGLRIKDFSSFHDFSFKAVTIAERFSAENVALTRNLVINQDIGEIITAGVKVHISNCHIRGKIIFQK